MVPVAQTRAHGGTALTLLSFEACDNGCLVHVRLVPSRAWAVEAGSFLRPELSPEAADDRGRGYAARPHGMTGDGHEWRVQFVLAPALDPAAREGRLTVPALRWQRLERGARPGPPTRPCPAPGPALST